MPKTTKKPSDNTPSITIKNTSGGFKKKDGKITINEPQTQAINHTCGPLLVVAGAGTGKTRVITERIKHLIQDENIKPQEILALTFTEKAAHEMVTRVGDVMPLGYEEPWIYTFHSFADRILKTEALEIGLDPSYKIMSTPDQWLLVRKNLFKFNLKYFRPLGNPTKFIGAILKFISRLQDENITQEELNSFTQKFDGDTEEKSRWTELTEFYKKYAELKLSHSKMDFGDLILWLIRLFKERPLVLKKYQTQFKHVLVDEFQDTNYAQYELIKMLFPNAVNTTDRSLIVVGDDSQSIYKFRGAAVSNILEFMRDYPSAQMVTLLQNYRSTQSILDPSYKLVQNNNPDTLESKLGISKELISEVSKSGLKPQVFQTETVEDEVELVVSKILEILAKEPQYTYKDIAILARANNHLDPFLLALRKYGLPYQLVGNRGLYDREEVRDLMALLKIIVDQSDGVSLYRALNISTLEIPFNVIAELLALSRLKKEDFWLTIKNSKDENVINFCQIVTQYQQAITKSTPTQFVYNLANSVNYMGQFLKEENVENQLSLNNLNLFLEKVKKFEVDYRSEKRTNPNIIDFIDYMELMIEAGENPAQAEIEDIDTINLLTVHASKGLEFPVVFMVNLVSDRFPTRDKSDPIKIPDELIQESLPTGDEHIQEERRLFYVGMTRAQKYLFLTLAKNYGGKREKTPSGFIQETGLATEFIETDSIKKARSQESLFGVNSGFREPRAEKIKDFSPAFLSYSQVDTFLNCPLQYKYAYILKIPTPPNNALSFGTTIHDTLRDFHSKLMFNGNVTLEDVLATYEKSWQPLGYLDENHRSLQFEAGKRLLENYYNTNKNIKAKHKALEKPFNIKIDGIKFYGRIDRIDELEDGTIEIIDYKTGNPKTQKDVDKDSQVAFYAIAAKEALGLKADKLSLYFVESNEKISTTRTEKQLEEKKQEVTEVINRIRSGNFAATPGMQCNWCDYSEICPFRYKG
jgi:DNA helicase II / ATP-dependent DNA helicase PcrA